MCVGLCNLQCVFQYLAFIFIVEAALRILLRAPRVAAHTRASVGTLVFANTEVCASALREGGGGTL